MRYLEERFLTITLVLKIKENMDKMHTSSKIKNLLPRFRGVNAKNGSALSPSRSFFECSTCCKLLNLKKDDINFQTFSFAQTLLRKLPSVRSHGILAKIQCKILVSLAKIMARSWQGYHGHARSCKG